MRLLLFFVGLIFFASCVSNKKVTLLQKDDLHSKNLPKDSVIRDYTIVPFDYKIQTNDALYISFNSLTPAEFNFFDPKNISGTSSSPNMNSYTVQITADLVDEQGEVPFPVIGKVKVSGLTVFEVQDKLQKLAEQYLESPIVKVRLVNYRITVLGEVNTESSITLTNNRVTLMEALGLVGGLTDLADRSNIKVIRQIGGKSEVQYVNLLDETFISSPYYYVNQNDIIIVPPLKQRPFRKYFGQNLSVILSSISLLLIVINLTK